ncbi:unnamed protein product, partial [Brassica oleracea var. botrytis]
MVARITGLEATVAKLGASNERLKQKLHRKRKRSRATSLLPQFVVTHRRRSAPQAPQTNDLPGDDHHDSPNSNRRKTKQVSDGILGSGSPILSQYCAQYCASRRIDFNNPFFTDHLLVDHPSADHTSSPHQYPGPHSPLSHSHNQRSTPLLATDHNSSDHISPNHQTHNHPSPTSGYANHNSPNHDPQSCEALVVDPLDHAPPIHIHPTTTTSDTPAPDHNSPLPTFSLAQHSPTMNTSTELSPLFTAVTSPKHPLPPAHALSHQGSLSQQYAPIGTLPEFDATPLNKPSSQSSPSHGHTLPEPDTAPPVYDSSALLYSPIPLFNPTPAATTPPTISPNPLFTPPPGLTTTPTSSPNKLTGFSTHYSTPNAFAATASLKGSTSRLIYQDPTNKHGVGEASDSSPDKTVRRVVDELNVLAQTFLNRPDFPHYLLVTPPPEDLWDIFAKTMATNKKSLPRHTFKTRLQQPVSPPTRNSLPVDRLSGTFIVVVLVRIGFTMSTGHFRKHVIMSTIQTNTSTLRHQPLEHV